jgi:hypothetical protein
MTVAITGLKFRKGGGSTQANSDHIFFVGSGTYVAADFTIDTVDGLGFPPSKVIVLNLTDRNSTTWWRDPLADATANTGLDGGDNAKGLKDAAGTPTYANAGITSTDRSVTVDISVAGPITDNCDFVIEMWR